MATLISLTWCRLPGRFLQFAANVGSLADEVVTWELPRATGGKRVTVPVTYDGPDLPQVARLTGLTVDEVVALHSGADLTVAFCGFSPGFGYLTGLPEIFMSRAAPSRAAPCRGAVGIAGEFTGVYPRSSPGGWQLIGTALVEMWDDQRDPPALVEPGDRVLRRTVTAWRLLPPGGSSAPTTTASLPASAGRLRAATAGRQQLSGWYSCCRACCPARRSCSTVLLGGHSQAVSVHVVRAGPLTTVEDLGRPGYAHLGVPPSELSTCQASGGRIALSATLTASQRWKSRSADSRSSSVGLRTSPLLAPRSRFGA